MGRWGRLAATAAAMQIAVAAATGVCGDALAQAPCPSRPVHILAPYPAGAVDVLTRTLGDVVSKQWGQSVVVENRPGAGGVIASQAVATAPPDGYTAIMVASGYAINQLLHAKVPHGTFNDFTPVSLLGSSSNILRVRADMRFNTAAGAHRLSLNAPDYPDARPFHEALARANPERLVWGGDRPHPRLEREMPAAGHLLELFQAWTPDNATRQRFLVDHPASL